MSKKYSRTTADYLEWDQNINLIHKLYNDKDYKMSLLLSIGSFWGLRVSDILQLKWKDIMDKEQFTLIEKKTNKERKIKINQELRLHITDCHKKINPSSLDEYIFLSQKGSVYSIQRINVIFKQIKKRYNLKINNFSTHSMRKTFGREVFNRAGTGAELALVKLAEIFNHANISTTKRYLGITQQELLKVYDELTF